MEVTQIATQLNEWLAERCGDARFDADTAAQFIVREDLANIVDIGTAVYKYEWQDNFVKSMIDRIGRMVFVNRRTRGFAPDLQRNAWEYGSVMSKSRTKRFEAKENPSWKLQKGLRISCQPVISSQPVNRTGLAVGVLGRVRRFSVVSDRPVHSAVDRVFKAAEEAPGMVSVPAEVIPVQHEGSCGKEPQDAAVQDAAFVRFPVQL